MKKILVFGFTDVIGGIECFYMNYYRHLNMENYQIDFICPNKKIVFEEELKSKKSKIYYVPHFKKKPLQYYKEVKKILKNNQYDITHINMLSTANIIPILLANKYNIKKIIVHAHASGIINSKIKTILDRINKRIIKKYKNNYVACSKEAGEWMFGKDSDFTVINNSIDFKKFKYNNKDRINVRKNLNIEDSDFVIGHVGRFSNEKNQIFLIEIMKRIVFKNKNIKLLLIGEGPTKESIKKIIQIEKLQKNVLVINSTKEIQKYYNAMDLFAFPSIYEGLGMVAIEAQISGLSCIFSENIVKTVDINNNNKYIKLENIDKWTKEIENRSKKQKKREFNEKKMNEKGFNIENELKKFKEIYEIKE